MSNMMVHQVGSDGLEDGRVDDGEVVPSLGDLQSRVHKYYIQPTNI